jgi:two-component system sensor histidine kinase TctE
MQGASLLLHEAIADLIDNAIKYTPSGGRVTVRSRCGERACIEVEDNGIGIPELEHARVFERFYRVLGTGVDGSGLGLAIVKEIVELFGGSVGIEHSPGGRGTLVRLSFPMAAGAPAGSAAVRAE